MKILIVVTSTNKYQNHPLETGLWLSEVTHLYEECLNNNIAVDFASPLGGIIPIDPECLKFFVLDKTTKKYLADKIFNENLHSSQILAQVDENLYDAIYLAGGHGTMYDFVGNEPLNALIQKFYEKGKIVAAVCHGVCGLIDAKLSDGNYLIKGKNLTGFAWIEEILARRTQHVPFNLEQIIKSRGGNYSKAFIPMTSKVVVDKNLITGQNPFSSKAIGKKIVEQLKLQKQPQ